jgi:hypothetical protein
MDTTKQRVKELVKESTFCITHYEKFGTDVTETFVNLDLLIELLQNEKVQMQRFHERAVELMEAMKDFESDSQLFVGVK